MKNSRRYLFLSIFIFSGVLFLFQREVQAAGTDFYESYTIEDDFEDYDFYLEAGCRLTIFMQSLDNDAYDDDDYYYDSREEKGSSDKGAWYGSSFSVEIWDENVDTVFEETLYGEDIYQETITLPAGEYTVYMSGDQKCTLTLSGSYLPTLSSDNISLEQGKTKTLKVKGTSKRVIWNSRNSSVASVSSRGVVKGKKPGRTTITAKCDGYNLKCSVTVTKKPPTYKLIAKKMRNFAGKNRNFVYRNIDVGNRCRLYAKKDIWLDGSSIYSEGYFTVASFQPYIELVKKNNKPVMSLRVEGYLEKQSVNSTSLHCSEMMAFTSNRRMKFKMKHVSGRNMLDYSTYLYKGTMKGYAEISASSNVREADLKKFETMTGQGSLAMRIKSTDSTVFHCGITSSVRKTWNKLVKEYRTLLKEY